MPTFSLNAVPGLLGQITITENASGVPAQIGLNDTVLFLPGSQKVDVQASHQKDTNNKHLLTLIAVLQSAPNLIGGQISLTSLTLTLLFVADSTGTLVLDTTAAPVTAQGSARWTGASALGIQGGVDLTIRYVFRRDGPGGFVLALANTPVAMPGGFAEILQGEIGVEVLAGEAAFAVFARGQARFTQGGMGQVNQLLARVFPGQPAVQPLGFEVRQKFGLVNGAIPSSPSSFGPPLFTIDCNFGAGPAPALTNAPQPLRIDLGFPRFSLPLGGGGWSLHFPNTGIRFPDIPSLTPFSLSGILHLESGPVNQLSFQPAQSGEFSLSDPLRFLLDRLGWNGTRTPLDRVPSEASQSVGEFEWQDLFRNLMPDPIPSAGIDVAALAQQLGAAIQSALQNAGLEIERVFLTAFRGLETGGPAAFQAGWHNWFTADIGPADPVAKLPGLLLSLQSLGGAAWNDAMQALFSRNFSLPDFGREYVKSFAASSDLRFLDFLSTWERILANLSPAQIGSLAGGWMNAIVRLPELSPSRNFPPLPGMTLPRMATGEGLLTATFGQMIRTAAQGGSSRFSDWLTEIFGATKRSDRDEAQRAREAYQNAIDAAGKDAPELSLIQFLHLVVAILRKNAFPWWQLIANPPEARDPHTWRKLSAPGSGPPSAKRKYLIFSDVHRDREQDAHPVDPDNLRLFQSIAHFTKNKDLYLAALQYANSRKYTVIENGDCEELWFYTDIEELNREEVIDGQRYKGRPKLLKQILKTHPRSTRSCANCTSPDAISGPTAITIIFCETRSASAS